MTPVQRARSAACALAAGALLGACPAPPAPFYDDDIGVEALPIEPGTLAGTFALKTLNVRIVHVPVLGDYEGGGVNYRLVERTYDATTDTYAQQSQLCGGRNFEVAGVTTDEPQSSYRRVPRSTAETVTVNADGAYEATGHLQLWALRDLPDPFNTPLPDRAGAAGAPWTDRIFDMDEDGEPGFSAVLSGALEGKVYAFQRKTVNIHGVVRGPDLALGLADNVNELVTLGASNDFIDRPDEGSSEPHPDPKQSWFQEARLPDGADCDDVIVAETQGLLSAVRPF